MNIVVVGGRSRADRLIAELLTGRNHIVAINNDRAYCRYLSARHDIDVVWGNGTQLRVLEGAFDDVSIEDAEKAGYDNKEE